MPTLEEFLGPLEDEFERRLRSFIASSGGRLYIKSGYRTPEHQRTLWCNKAKEFGHYGNCDPNWMKNNVPSIYSQVRHWVAVPGHSNHNRGVAADLGYNTGQYPDAVRWAHANAARFGLVFPLGHEDWHIEPLGLRDGSYSGEPFDIGTEVSDLSYSVDDRQLSPEEIKKENRRLVFNVLTANMANTGAGTPGFGQAPEPDGVTTTPGQVDFGDVTVTEGAVVPPADPLEAPFNEDPATGPTPTPDGDWQGDQPVDEGHPDEERLA